MRKIPLENISKIIKNKKRLEQALEVNIDIKGKNLEITGNEINEYLALEVLEAINFSFDIDTALLLENENFCFEKINIKNITKRHNLSEIRARIIGTKGKTKRTIENLSECEIKLHDNIIGVIGREDCIKNVIHAITKLIQGSKQSSVYAFLERQRAKSKNKEEDFGLKTNL